MFYVPMRKRPVLTILRHPVTAYMQRKAKKIYYKDHLECAMCGIRPTFLQRANQVHRIIPAHECFRRGHPEWACEPWNFITLCMVHHFLIGHLGHWKRWNSKIVETIQEIQAVFKRIVKQSHLMNANKRALRLGVMLVSGLVTPIEQGEKEAAKKAKKKAKKYEEESDTEEGKHAG